MKDIEIFSSEYEVMELPFVAKVKLLLPFYLLLQLLKLIILRLKSRYFVVQFGGYHSLLPALIARFTRGKSCIILGGYDAVSIPEISYGAFANPWMRRAVTGSYKWTDLLLPVHESLIETTSNFGVEKSQNRGVKAYMKNFRTKWITVYNGYDTSGEFKSNGNRLYPKSVITIASGCAEKRRKVLKGVDLVLATAPLLPDFEWVVVGDLLEDLPSNVRSYPTLNSKELSAAMSQCSVVVQASLSEGFPNALCEAMIAGCVPVVSPVAAMPEIIGTWGEVIQEKSPKQLAEAVLKAFKRASENHTKCMKDHIEMNFSFDKRKRELLKALNDLFQ